jgi:OFA family oxalate/formate antiporter-like MFS transporter
MVYDAIFNNFRIWRVLVSTIAIPPRASVAQPGNQRWRHLILSVVCMIMIANLQYGWSVFVLPLQKARGWSVSDIQIAFTIFVALETWATPINGWIADKLGPDVGPRTVMGVGGVLVGLGWIINSYAVSLPALYIGGALSGLGSGAVYCTAVGTAVKWFKDHRGLAVGLVAGGFGAGAALTIIPIQMVIAKSGYASAFLWFGLIQGGVVLIVSQFIRNPHQGEAPESTSVKAQQTSRSYTAREVLGSRVFWVLYLLDLLMCAGGLVVTAYLAPIATSYHISDIQLFWGASTLSIALVFANVMNGVARPFFGWVSDQIGLWQTMAIAFVLGAASYFFLFVLGNQPWGFVFFTGMIFFCWGEIFSLFPAMCTDLFGAKFATTNTSMLYTAKGAAAFLVPVGGILAVATGNWNDVLFLATGINVIAVILVYTVLRPAANRHHTMDKIAEPSPRLPVNSPIISTNQTKESLS